MKRIISKLIATLTVITLCTISTPNVHAAELINETPVTTMETVDSISRISTDDGWSSGSFYWYYTTGIKYFEGGTIYVGINSSNPHYNGTYTIQILSGSTVIYSFNVLPANGLMTINFTDMPSGYYRLHFISGDDTSLQSYEILAYGTV